MKCQNLFSGKNKKSINMSFAELAHTVVKVNNTPLFLHSFVVIYKVQCKPLDMNF